MRVGLVIYDNLQTLSGGYLYDRMLVDYLRRQGDQVEVISIPRHSYLRALTDNVSTDLIRRLESLQIDLLLQDELNHASLFWLNRRLQRQRSYTIISIVHHLRSSELRPAWQNRLTRKIERCYLRSVDGFIYNSQTTRQAVAALVGGKPAGVVAYPAGDRLHPQVDDKDVRRRAAEAGPLRLVFVGNLIPRKGLHLLLEAIRALPEGSCKLEVIGRPDADPAYSRRIYRQAANGLSGKVHFAGKLSDAHLAERLAKSHVLVVPSTYEGYGIIYLEGMGFGLPAVASQAGAAGEIISAGENGCLITLEDVPALSQCLVEFAGDRELLTRRSLAALQTYRSAPGWERTGETIRSYLLSLISSKMTLT